jgi:hypothetical protein
MQAVSISIADRLQTMPALPYSKVLRIQTLASIKNPMLGYNMWKDQSRKFTKGMDIPIDENEA